MKGTTFKSTAAALGLGLVLASAAKADEVTFAGYTNGCFGVACVPPNTSAFQVAGLLPGLVYTNSTFDGTTSGGFLGIGNQPATPNIDNLGTFTLTGDASSYNSPFTLRVTFILPTGIDGSNTTTPSPRTKTSEFAVPRSTASSRPLNERRTPTGRRAPQ